MEAVLHSSKPEGTLAGLQEELKNLSALERGRKLRDLHSAGYTLAELAQALGCNESLIRQLIKLAELPATVLEEYEAGEIGRKRALRLARELARAKPPKVKTQTRIKRGARAIEAWVREEIPPYIWEVFFQEVQYEAEGPQGWVFKLAARPEKLGHPYADPAAVIADSRPLEPRPTYGPYLTNWLVAWYARWFQRLLPERAEREEALRIVMQKLIPDM